MLSPLLAVNAASSGDNIMIQVPTDKSDYFENVDVNGKNLNLYGMPPIPPNYYWVTINGSLSGACIRIRNDSDCLISHIKFINGTGYNNGSNTLGGCICIQKGSGATGSDCLIKKCKLVSSYADFGGALYCKDSNVQVKESLIAECTAINGGGIYADSEVLTVNSCFIHSCGTGMKSCNKGGAIYLKNNDALIYDCNPDGDYNLDGYYGRIYNNRANTASPLGYGAGIYCDNSFPKIYDNLFEHNLADRGGAIAVSSTDASPTDKIEIYDNKFGFDNDTDYSQANQAPYGGAIYIDCDDYHIVEIYRNAITYNKAIYGGGGLALLGEAKFHLHDNAIIGCLALGDDPLYTSGNAYGGGIYAVVKAQGSNAKLVITNNTFRKTKVEADTSNYEARGGAIYAYYNDTADGYVCEWWNNLFYETDAESASDYDEIYAITDGDEEPLLNFKHNYSDSTKVDVDDNYDDYYASNGTSGSGPGLISSWHLGSGAYCIDRGMLSAPGISGRDIDKESRCVDGDGDYLAAPDQGCDEYPGD
jgi:hypothetical protein